jgi:hypothetical protein
MQTELNDANKLMVTKLMDNVAAKDADVFDTFRALAPDFDAVKPVKAAKKALSMFLDPEEFKLPLGGEHGECVFGQSLCTVERNDTKNNVYFPLPSHGNVYSIVQAFLVEDWVEAAEVLVAKRKRNKDRCEAYLEVLKQFKGFCQFIYTNTDSIPGAMANSIKMKYHEPVAKAKGDTYAAHTTTMCIYQYNTLTETFSDVSAQTRARSITSAGFMVNYATRRISTCAFSGHMFTELIPAEFNADFSSYRDDDVDERVESLNDIKEAALRVAAGNYTERPQRQYVKISSDTNSDILNLLDKKVQTEIIQSIKEKHITMKTVLRELAERSEAMQIAIAEYNLLYRGII